MPGSGTQALAAGFVIRVIEAEGKLRPAEILRPESYKTIPEPGIHRLRLLFFNSCAPKMTR